MSRTNHSPRCWAYAGWASPRLRGGVQKRKLIDYSRGDVTILDRSGLEAVSYRCYGADLETYERVMA